MDANADVDGIADDAFHSMMRAMEDVQKEEEDELLTNKSILVSGESGAGKTGGCSCSCFNGLYYNVCLDP